MANQLSVYKPKKTEKKFAQSDFGNWLQDKSTSVGNWLLGKPQPMGPMTRMQPTPQGSRLIPTAPTQSTPAPSMPAMSAPSLSWQGGLSPMQRTPTQAGVPQIQGGVSRIPRMESGVEASASSATVPLGRYRVTAPPTSGAYTESLPSPNRPTAPPPAIQSLPGNPRSETMQPTSIQTLPYRPGGTPTPPRQPPSLRELNALGANFSAMDLTRDDMNSNARKVGLGTGYEGDPRMTQMMRKAALGTYQPAVGGGTGMRDSQWDINNLGPQSPQGAIAQSRFGGAMIHTDASGRAKFIKPGAGGEMPSDDAVRTAMRTVIGDRGVTADQVTPTTPMVNGVPYMPERRGSQADSLRSYFAQREAAGLKVPERYASVEPPLGPGAVGGSPLYRHDFQRGPSDPALGAIRDDVYRPGGPPPIVQPEGGSARDLITQRAQQRAMARRDRLANRNAPMNPLMAAMQQNPELAMEMARLNQTGQLGMLQAQLGQQQLAQQGLLAQQQLGFDRERLGVLDKSNAEDRKSRESIAGIESGAAERARQFERDTQIAAGNIDYIRGQVEAGNLDPEEGDQRIAQIESRLGGLGVYQPSQVEQPVSVPQMNGTPALAPTPRLPPIGVSEKLLGNQLGQEFVDELNNMAGDMNTSRGGIPLFSALFNDPHAKAQRFAKSLRQLEQQGKITPQNRRQVAALLRSKATTEFIDDIKSRREKWKPKGNEKPGQDYKDFDYLLSMLQAS